MQARHLIRSLLALLFIVLTLGGATIASAVATVPAAAGKVTEYSIPTSVSYPVGITAGPDGNLWFTEGHKNRIGRITPSGTITEFRLPTPKSHPDGITAGPDGNLWFTEASSAANKIGKITTH